MTGKFPKQLVGITLAIILLFLGLGAIPVTTPVQIKIIEPAAVSIPSWKTYTDDTNGFYLQYPGTWGQVYLRSERGNTAVLSPYASERERGGQVQATYINVVSNPNKLTSLEYFEQVLKPYQEGSTCKNFLINTNVPTTLKNLDVTIIEGMCGILNQGPEMVVAKSDRIIDISSSFIDEIDSDLVYQILSTFKLIKLKTPMPTVRPVSLKISDWKTYQNPLLGFELKYPANYYLKTENTDQHSKVIISNHPEFNKDEWALVINIEPLADSGFEPSIETQHLKILNSVGYDQLVKSFPGKVAGNFMGDPPWGYYQINIGHLLVTVRIDESDEWQATEIGSTNGQVAAMAKLILSTFKLH